MNVVLTLGYIVFTVCLVYPPTEFVAAGFTIGHLFDSYLGSENVDFINYHMKRITITSFIHSVLPLGYIASMFICGERGSLMLVAFAGAVLLPLVVLYWVLCWWERKTKHPAVRALIPFVPEGGDWRVVAATLNTEFRGVDKVSIPLTATSKLIATETWLIKVSSYSLNIIKQTECALVATDTDIPDLTASSEDEIQYVNIRVVPSRTEISPFTFRITTAAMRDLQVRLANPVRVPAHISLMPTMIERFVIVFKHHVDQNPVYYVDELSYLTCQYLSKDMEDCIGCMQAKADVKITRRCLPPPAHVQGGPPECQQCNCRVLWCCSCMARWWAARAGAAGGAPAEWLSARCSCPVCRAVCCLLDVCPALRRSS